MLLQLTDECRFHGITDNLKVRDAHGLFLRLQSLIRGYLRHGAVVYGSAALHDEFGTADFLLLLDVQKWSGEYLGRFGLRGTQVRHAVG